MKGAPPASYLVEERTSGVLVRRFHLLLQFCCPLCQRSSTLVHQFRCVFILNSLLHCSGDTEADGGRCIPKDECPSDKLSQKTLPEYVDPECVTQHSSHLC